MRVRASVTASAIIHGAASGAVLWSDQPLSVWGGIDPLSGRVIDRHHPLCGQTVSGRILCLPGGRGSCTGSIALLEMIVAGTAPAGLVLTQDDAILPLGVLAGELLFGLSIPVVRVDADHAAAIAISRHAIVAGDQVHLSAEPMTPPVLAEPAPTTRPAIALSARDAAMLGGEHGAAAALAMRGVIGAAAFMGAGQLIDVSRVHIDACIYTGPAVLRAARHLAGLGGRFIVPTTLNAISVDQRRWRELGCDPGASTPASDLADAYAAMGARRSYTCAPYLLADAPAPGEVIAWGESNAVVFANSVLGARTLKTPDLLDVFIALTGRAPFAGPYLDSARQPDLAITVSRPALADESFYPLLGHIVGERAAGAIPLIRGLESAAMTRDDLKAFGAAFATTSAAPMFHIAGMTPDTPGMILETNTLPMQAISHADLRAAYQALDASADQHVDLVALGNPHLSVTEIARIAAWCGGRRRHDATALVLTIGRDVAEQARGRGLLEPIIAFGGLILNDTCWCMLAEPIVPPSARTIMTNSAKYAHYGPGLTGREFRFGGLTACLEAAITGLAPKTLPRWLDG